MHAGFGHYMHFSTGMSSSHLATWSYHFASNSGQYVCIILTDSKHHCILSVGQNVVVHTVRHMIRTSSRRTGTHNAHIRNLLDLLEVAGGGGNGRGNGGGHEKLLGLLTGDLLAEHLPQAKRAGMKSSMAAIHFVQYTNRHLTAHRQRSHLRLASTTSAPAKPSI